MPKPAARLPVASSAYARFVAELKARIGAARLSAARSVNRELILLYWDIGRGIVEKQAIEGWGESVVERLAADLRSEFPNMRGFSSCNVWLMRQIYLEYTAPEFLAQAVPESAGPRGELLSQSVTEIGALGPSGRPSPFLEQPVQEILTPVPWGHHVELLKKVKDAAARLY